MCDLKFKRVLTSIICLLFLATGLTGCEGKANKLKIAQDVAQEIVDAFINEDEEALYSLFNQEAKDYSMTREQIQDAFDFIDGDIVSYELPTDTGGGGGYTENWRVMAEHMTPEIYLETDTEKLYRIWFRYCLVFRDDKNVEGLGRIAVSLLDEKRALVERLPIGYEQDENSRFPSRPKS